MRDLGGELRNRWARSSAMDHAWRLGVFSVALLVIGSGWYQAWGVAPYRLADEQAHAGYVLALQRGRLPTIDQPILAQDGGPVLQERVDLTKDRYGEVWVANNPPLAYLLYVPPAALTRALGWPGGPLMGIRLANLACFGLAVAMTARLGRRLGGGDRRIGLIAAGMLAAVPHVAVIAGAGFVDGLALLASVGLFDALASIARRGPTRRQIAVLSGWCVLAVGVRPMSALLAVVAGALAMGIVALRAWRTQHEASDRQGHAGLVWSGLVLAIPTIVVNGWFYVRSQRLYGDPTGSQRLLEKFDRVARDSPFAAITRPSIWVQPVRTLLNRKVTYDTPGPPLSWWTITTWGLAFLIGAAIVLIVVDQVQSRRRGTTARTPGLAWGCLAVCGAAAVLLTAQHWSGGGTIHPRYLFPALAILVALIAIPLVRFGTVWAGVAVVVVLVALTAHETPAQNRYYEASKAAARAGSPLNSPIGPPWLRGAAVVMVAVALAGLVVAAWFLRDDRPEIDGDAEQATSSLDHVA